VKGKIIREVTDNFCRWDGADGERYFVIRFSQFARSSFSLGSKEVKTI